MRYHAFILAAAAAVAGCSSGPFRDFGLRQYAGANYLEEGVRNYEEGNYKTAARRLQYGLEEGLARPDRVKAHKYLAFIACVSGQPLTCREEFGIALDLDPKLTLDEAEAGHPIWGPVFQNLKAKQKANPSSR